MLRKSKTKIEIKDIGKKLEKEILHLAKVGLKICETDKEIAEYVKTTLDDKYGGPWNAIVGKKFGGNVTFIPNHFIYFIMKEKHFLVYSTRNMRGPKHDVYTNYSSDTYNL